MTNCLCLCLLFVVGTLAYDLLPNPNGNDSGRYKDWYKTKSQLKLDDNDITRSIVFSTSNVDSLKRLEENILNAQISNNKNIVVSNADNTAITLGKHAFILEKASVHLLSHYCYKNKLASNKCMLRLADYNASMASTNTQLKGICASFSDICPEKVSIRNKYRSLTGGCNHSGGIGGSFTSYKRLLLPEYLDGVHTLRRSVQKKFTLPSARLISGKLIHHDDDDETDTDIVEKLTLAFAHWGEFIEHDMAQTVAHKMIHFDSSIECCSSNGDRLAPRHLHPFCQPILVPNDDKFYSEHYVKCLSYVRSIGAIRNDCSFGPLDQLNQATHYLDASNVYGNDVSKSERLRNGIRGEMRMSSRSYLPKTVTARNKVESECREKNHECYEAGDARVNSHPQLTALHTVFLREHNRLAEILSKLNPEWNDETLYQEARRILIAEVQHITYREWLPLVLSENEMRKIAAINEFHEGIDPSISNSFATAGIRFIKSLIPGSIQLFNEDRTLNSSIKLGEHFYKTHVVEEINSIDLLLRGLVTQNSRKLDLKYTKDLVDIFGDKMLGLDVISLDIQRGRDHGLPSYNAYRKLCGMKAANVFKDLIENIPSETIKLLSQIYKHPNDIDLIIGGLAETPQKGSLLGSTFTCLIADQFRRTRNGDRYFYSFVKDKTAAAFTDKQLKEIEKATLAKILCNNADHIEGMQVHAFLSIDNKSNPLKSCHELIADDIDLDVWKS